MPKIDYKLTENTIFAERIEKLVINDMINEHEEILEAYPQTYDVSELDVCLTWKLFERKNYSKIRKDFKFRSIKKLLTKKVIMDYILTALQDIDSELQHAIVDTQSVNDLPFTIRYKIDYLIDNIIFHFKPVKSLRELMFSRTLRNLRTRFADNISHKDFPKFLPRTTDVNRLAVTLALKNQLDLTDNYIYCVYIPMELEYNSLRWDKEYLELVKADPSLFIGGYISDPFVFKLVFDTTTQDYAYDELKKRAKAYFKADTITESGQVPLTDLSRTPSSACKIPLIHSGCRLKGTKKDKKTEKTEYVFKCGIEPDRADGIFPILFVPLDNNKYIYDIYQDNEVRYTIFSKIYYMLFDTPFLSPYSFRRMFDCPKFVGMYQDGVVYDAIKEHFLTSFEKFEKIPKLMKNEFRVAMLNQALLSYYMKKITTGIPYQARDGDYIYEYYVLDDNKINITSNPVLFFFPPSPFYLEFLLDRQAKKTSISECTTEKNKEKKLLLIPNRKDVLQTARLQYLLNKQVYMIYIPRTVNGNIRFFTVSVKNPEELDTVMAEFTTDIENMRPYDYKESVINMIRCIYCQYSYTSAAGRDEALCEVGKSNREQFINEYE